MNRMTSLPVYSITYWDLAPVAERLNVRIVRVGRHWPSGVKYVDIEYDGATLGRRQPWDAPDRVRPAGPCRVRERVYP
jgi:hypothetical protein